MSTANTLQKKVIKALTNAPAAALRELVRRSTDPDEREQIKRIAAALGVKLEGQKMEIIYTETARGIHAIAAEMKTIADAIKKKERLTRAGYTVNQFPRAFDDANGRRVYIIYAWRSICTQTK